MHCYVTSPQSTLFYLDIIFSPPSKCPVLWSIFTRDSIYAIARICHANSVCPSSTRVLCVKTAERIRLRNIRITANLKLAFGVTQGHRNKLIISTGSIGHQYEVLISHNVSTSVSWISFNTYLFSNWRVLHKQKAIQNSNFVFPLLCVANCSL